MSHLRETFSLSSQQSYGSTGNNLPSKKFLLTGTRSDDSEITTELILNSGQRCHYCSYNLDVITNIELGPHL